LKTSGDTALSDPRPRAAFNVDVGLLTGGFDKPYAFGLAMALSAREVGLDVIGSDEVDSPEMHNTPGLNFLNFYGNPRAASHLRGKAMRVLVFYMRLIRYTCAARPRLFHILWNNKLQFFDRTALMMFYKLMGKRIVFTAHNVNAGKRDSNDSFLNRWTLRIQYLLADHIFVHTEKMKTELLQDFGAPREKVTVIPFGLNDSVPDTALTPAEARQRLGITQSDKAILFFGAIRPYKGLEYLVDAFRRLAARDSSYRLIIAGEKKKGSEGYLEEIQSTISSEFATEQVIQRIAFIPDEETELYFKAADVLVLPYTLVFQSGVLFLSYNFGLPAVATQVGSFEDDIAEGETGFLCAPRDPVDLARAIETYFASDLFRTLDHRRKEIRNYASMRNSWDVVAEMTCGVYQRLLDR
jgi:D-inositol-3-phosphate glycosyltransferase